MAQPTLVSYQSTTDFVSGGGGKSIASVSRQTGDILVFIAISEGPDAIVPTNDAVNGITWTTQRTNSAAGTCGSVVATAVAGSTSSALLQASNGGSSSDHWGFAIWVFRNSNGVGNSAEQHTTAKIKALTPAGGVDSAIVWAAADFSAGATPAATPSPTNTRQAVQDGGAYSFIVADITDQASSGSVNYGLTVGGTTGPYSIVIQEVEGIPSAGDTSSLSMKFNYQG